MPRANGLVVGNGREKLFRDMSLIFGVGSVRAGSGRWYRVVDGWVYWSSIASNTSTAVLHRIRAACHMSR